MPGFGCPQTRLCDTSPRDPHISGSRNPWCGTHCSGDRECRDRQARAARPRARIGRSPLRGDAPGHGRTRPRGFSVTATLGHACSRVLRGRLQTEWHARPPWLLPRTRAGRAARRRQLRFVLVPDRIVRPSEHRAVTQSRSSGGFRARAHPFRAPTRGSPRVSPDGQQARRPGRINVAALRPQASDSCPSRLVAHLPPGAEGASRESFGRSCEAPSARRFG